MAVQIDLLSRHFFFPNFSYFGFIISICLSLRQILFLYFNETKVM